MFTVILLSYQKKIKTSIFSVLEGTDVYTVFKIVSSKMVKIKKILLLKKSQIFQVAEKSFFNVETSYSLMVGDTDYV